MTRALRAGRRLPLAAEKPDATADGDDEGFAADTEGDGDAIAESFGDGVCAAVACAGGDDGGVGEDDVGDDGAGAAAGEGEAGGLALGFGVSANAPAGINRDKVDATTMSVRKRCLRVTEPPAGSTQRRTARLQAAPRQEVFDNE